MFQGVPGQGKRIAACNQETLKVQGLRPGEERVCNSYPSNVGTLKGVGCDIGIMEVRHLGFLDMV